jgi:radical SAM protein with 4Fe4S-binding SPASM domain
MCGLPRNVTLHLTENCNLRCEMCYFWGISGCYSSTGSSSRPKVLDFQLVKNLINDLQETKPSYSLFGGEPLLYPQFEELIKEIKKGGSYLDTPTNGTLIAQKARMLVRSGFDSVRVSIDGPKKINDKQRGKGSYERAMKGIEILYGEKLRNQSKTPSISIIYTITTSNFDELKQFFLEDLNIKYIDWVTIQMQNFITKEMGDAYSNFLKSEFGDEKTIYWKSLVRSKDDFSKIDVNELSRQVKEVHKVLIEQNKNILLLPPTFSPQNLRAYINAEWDKMQDQYNACYSPFVSVDIVANGDVAPCHIFYDLVMGNLHEQSIKEIWNDKRYIKFRNIMKQQTFMPICNGCCILYLAGRKMKKKK